MLIELKAFPKRLTKWTSTGIPVQITNENLQGAYCLDGMVPGVLVPASHVEQAKQIITEVQQSSEKGLDDDEQEQ
jgi:hypothetical protein